MMRARAWALPLAGAGLLAASAVRAAPRRAALFGWASGVGWLGAGTWWLFISMHRYGHLAAPLAAAAVLALAAALSLYLGAAMAAFARWRCGRPVLDALLFGAAWLLAELARGVLFTGFPWVASGYAQVDGPLAPLAPWVGVYGIGAWGAFAAALVALALPRRPGPAGLGVALVVLPLALAGQSFSRPSGSLTVTLLQTNVSQDDKFAAEKMPAELDWVAARLEAARGELVMAPETAVPLLPDQLEQVDPGYWKALAARFSGPGQAALVGVPLGDYDHGYTNSVAGLSAGPRYRYDKHHLVPFGEFIPTGFRWFTELMDIPLGDFKRGVANPPSFPVRGERVAPNICYEDLFGEELARRFADPARAPTLFANVSNLGWFGDTEILAQHLNISRMRALEFERPMIRSTNTGATAIIDFRGRVTAELPVYARMTLDGSVQGRIGITPYAWWAARAGLWPLGLAALALIAAARRRSSQELYR
ncbi:MAG: apolipoprotein N-acyltransferase [Burkholderiales bacterium]|nr:apolipoprotein N-acyltransferase [Burkholderiales bacterium]